MSKDDWFRNKEWDDEIAATFEVKLRRARSKEQYLRIQAGTLKELRPDVTHILLDEYFKLPDQFDAAQAHVDRAGAYLTQGKVSDAILSYESALNREIVFPNLKTGAYVDLPFLVATHKITDQFDRALDLLLQHKSRLMFPVDHFKWNAAHALIAETRNDANAACQYAKAAMDAASRQSSGYQFHPTIGLVSNTLAEVLDRMRRLSDSYLET